MDSNHRKSAYETDEVTTPQPGDLIITYFNNFDSLLAHHYCSLITSIIEMISPISKINKAYVIFLSLELYTFL